MLVGFLGPDIANFPAQFFSTHERFLILQLFLVTIGILMLLLAAALEEQRKAAVSAQAALKVRDDFISVASHELKTPLSSLTMQVQLLNKYIVEGKLAQIEPSRLVKLAEISNRELKRFSSLINDLLDVSRISAGKLSFKPEEINLAELIREVVERLKIDLGEIECTLELDQISGVVGKWDRLRLDQVLSNLICNAIKYGEGKPITVSAHKEQEYVIISVVDHGIGIPEGHLKRVFQRFERAENTHRFQGLGLGLFISQQIAESHGGRITVSSVVGEGSTFTLQLPLNAFVVKKVLKD